MIAVDAHARGCVLKVRAYPGARSSALDGEHDGALRVKVATAPEQGKANAAIIEVLSRSLGLKKSQLELLHGAGSRQKSYLVINVTPADLQSRLATALLD